MKRTLFALPLLLGMHATAYAQGDAICTLIDNDHVRTFDVASFDVTGGGVFSLVETDVLSVQATTGGWDAAGQGKTLYTPTAIAVRWCDR